MKIRAVVDTLQAVDQGAAAQGVPGRKITVIPNKLNRGIDRNIVNGLLIVQNFVNQLHILC